MAQAFRPGFNTVARVTLWGALLGPVLFLWLASEFNWSSYVTRARVPRDQPVPFSHQHHVGQLGIDCRYCHTGVEESSYAGIPPTRTCMTCHSQVWKDAPVLEPVRESWRTGQPIPWVRVNDLPDFAYFNHSIHIAKGFGCVTCHGRVDQMPLTYKPQQFFMAWCLDCHRHPERYIRPRAEVFNLAWRPAPSQEKIGPRLVRDYHVKSLITCYTCHR
jgi:hypothetical protein